MGEDRNKSMRISSSFIWGSNLGYCLNIKLIVKKGIMTPISSRFRIIFLTNFLWDLVEIYIYCWEETCIDATHSI